MNPSHVLSRFFLRWGLALPSWFNHSLCIRETEAAQGTSPCPRSHGQIRTLGLALQLVSLPCSLQRGWKCTGAGAGAGRCGCGRLQDSLAC